MAIMNGSLGYLYANDIPYSPDQLLAINRQLVADVLADFRNVRVENARTNGERLYALYGMKGVRGEALSGYDTVLNTALPVLKRCLDSGASINDAGVMALLQIMACSEDTNIVNRSSYQEMKEIQNQIKVKLANPSTNCQELLSYSETLDQDFIRRNISPGGSADLLALAYFIYLYEQSLLD